MTIAEQFEKKYQEAKGQDALFAVDEEAHKLTSNVDYYNGNKIFIFADGSVISTKDMLAREKCKEHKHCYKLACN